MIPVIKGDLEISVNSFAHLTCVVPECFSKQGLLSYTWFINGTKMNEETKEMLTFTVTKNHKYNQYSCKAANNRLKSNRSTPVQINLLCKEHIYFTPTFIFIWKAFVLNPFIFLFSLANLKSEIITPYLNENIIVMGASIISGILVMTLASVAGLYFIKRGRREKNQESVKGNYYFLFWNKDILVHPIFISQTFLQITKTRWLSR